MMSIRLHSLLFALRDNYVNQTAQIADSCWAISLWLSYDTAPCNKSLAELYNPKGLRSRQTKSSASQSQNPAVSTSNAVWAAWLIMYAYIYIYIYIYIYTYITYTCVIYIYIYAHYVYIYIYIHTYMYTHMCVYIYIYICMHTHNMCIYIYIYTYMYIQVHQSPRAGPCLQIPGSEARGVDIGTTLGALTELTRPERCDNLLEGTSGGPKEWESQVTTGLIAFYSQLFTCSTARVDRWSNPLPWDPLSSPY